MSPTRSHLVDVVSVDGETSRRPDALVVEEPLEIRLDGHRVATTMRTPGHDVELAAGFCHGDGLLAGAPVRRAKHCGEGSDGYYNVIDVITGGLAPEPVPRLGNVSSSCGLCGSTAIDELRGRLEPLSGARIGPGVAIDIAAKVRTAQELFDETGAVHAAAAFGPDGALEVVREDIGRHNAVDKVVGRLLLDGTLDGRSRGLFVSGRASFEMVQKAWAAGFGTLVAVSAPSALAVDAAKRGGIGLIGFARPGRINVYS